MLRVTDFAALALVLPAHVLAAPSVTHLNSLQKRAEASSYNSCSPQTFPKLSLPGSEILSLTAAPVVNLTGIVSQYPDVTIPPVDICNVTITYTHTGWNDTIHANIWLPLSGWTGRLVGTGGGAYATRSGDDALAVEVAAGRAAYATDGGHNHLDPNPLSASSWALKADGKANLQLLQDFASVSLNDAAVLAKQVTKDFYSKAPSYTYWNGCSTGGRQGFMIAQRYPTAVDGVLAGAPAINWDTFTPGGYWPTFVMNQLKTVPAPCVLEAITNATIQACDKLDGVADGIISAPKHCKFDPATTVGQTVQCGPLGSTRITAAHVEVVKKIWQGPRASDGSFLYYGLEPGTPFNLGFALTTITCVGSATNCTVAGFQLASDWIRLFVLENPAFDLATVTLTDFEAVFQKSAAKYRDIIGTNNPDLSAFKTAGGKLISWHGLADQLVPPRGTEEYYEKVERLDPSVRSFFRHFEAPGVNHCFGGLGSAPTSPMDALIAWVEKGTAPASLEARSLDKARSRALCPYPLVAAYTGGDVNKAGSFACQSNFA